MTPTQNYKSIIEIIFQRAIDIPESENTNNCIGALNSNNVFSVFRKNFIERLKRLYKRFNNDSVALQHLIDTVRDIAFRKGYKWSGPYSELVALDFWLQNDNLENLRYVHKGNVKNFGESIAKQIGRTEIDIDLSFDLPYTKIYMDVKSLIPTHLELIDKILYMLKETISDKEYLIGIDNLFNVDYLRTKKDYTYELQHGNLLDCLRECINNKKTYYQHTLQSGKIAEFRIAYAKPGSNTILSLLRTKDPYSLALDYRYKVLDYFDKLLINKPSFILFVANPWFNNEFPDYDGFNETFYRALARRVFMELSKRLDDMGTYYSRLSGFNLKICDIVNLISGIIFIDDKSSQQTGDDIYKVYIYTNPNAKNRYFRKHDLGVFLGPSRGQLSAIDDFYYDNY